MGLLCVCGGGRRGCSVGLWAGSLDAGTAREVALAATNLPLAPLMLPPTAAQAGKDLPLERHQGAYALQKQVMEGVAADRALTSLGADAFRWAGLQAPAAGRQRVRVRQAPVPGLAAGPGITPRAHDALCLSTPS